MNLESGTRLYRESEEIKKSEIIMGQDFIIKNKRRHRKNTVQPYEPQYKRLGVEPIQYDVNKSRNDFERQAKEEQNMQNKKRDTELISLMKSFRNGEITEQDLINTLNPSQSSVNNDQLWVNGLSSQEQEEQEEGDDGVTISDRTIYNEQIPSASVQIPSSLNRSFYTNETVKQPRTYVAPEPEEPEEDEQISINQGDYVLMYNGDIVSIGSKESIYSTLKSLLKDNPEYLDNFILLKRVSIKHGFYVDE